MKKSKNENEGADKKAPSGGLFGQPSAAGGGSGLFSSASAEPKKPEASLSFLNTAKKENGNGSVSSLFGGAKPAEAKTTADSGASSSAKNPYL